MCKLQLGRDYGDGGGWYGRKGANILTVVVSRSMLFLIQVFTSAVVYGTSWFIRMMTGDVCFIGSEWVIATGISMIL